MELVLWFGGVLTGFRFCELFFSEKKHVWVRMISIVTHLNHKLSSLLYHSKHKSVFCMYWSCIYVNKYIIYNVISKINIYAYLSEITSKLEY